MPNCSSDSFGYTCSVFKKKQDRPIRLTQMHRLSSSVQCSAFRNAQDRHFSDHLIRHSTSFTIQFPLEKSLQLFFNEPPTPYENDASRKTWDHSPDIILVLLSSNGILRKRAMLVLIWRVGRINNRCYQNQRQLLSREGLWYCVTWNWRYQDANYNENSGTRWKLLSCCPRKESLLILRVWPQPLF